MHRLLELARVLKRDLALRAQSSCVLPERESLAERDLGLAGDDLRLLVDRLTALLDQGVMLALAGLVEADMHDDERDDGDQENS